MRILGVIVSSVAIFFSAPAFAECLILPSQAMSETFNETAVSYKRAAVEKNLIQTLRNFEKTLITAGPHIQQGWYKYLRWQEWAAPYLKDRTVNLKVMHQVSSFFYHDEPGLEFAPIIQLRIAFENFVDFMSRYQGHDMGSLASKFEENIEELSQLFGVDQICNYGKIEPAMTWLIVMNQSPKLVATVQKSFQNPSVIMSADKMFVEEALTQFNKTDTQRKYTANDFQGARVTGWSTITTNMAAEVVTSQDARIRIAVNGIVHSPNNVAAKGPVRVGTSAVTNFQAFADIFWDGQKIQFSAPQANANTRSTIKYVSGPPLIRRIAARKAQEMKRSGEIFAANMIKTQVKDEMNGQLRKAITNLDEQASELMSLMRRTGFLPLPASTEVVSSAVRIGLYPSSVSGISAAKLTYSQDSVEGMFSFSLHENAISKFAKRLIAGADWQDLVFANIQKELMGKNTPEHTIGVTRDRWSAAWDWLNPVRVGFDPEGITLKIRASSMKINNMTYHIPLEATSKFTIAFNSRGIEFKRIGPVTVNSLDPSQDISDFQRAFVIRKYAGFFDKGVNVQGFLSAFSSGKQKSPSVVQDMKTEDHWLHIGIDGIGK